jgi:hypothetical protein
MLDRILSGVSQLNPPLAAMAALLFVLFLWMLALTFRFRALGRRYRSLIASVSGMDLESTLSEYLSFAKDSQLVSQRSADQAERLASVQRSCFQRSGLVRFDAFDDVTGRLSFALALTDAAGDGLALTSVYGREGCRIYAKPLRGGVSEIPLSQEEREAIRLALSDSALTSKEAS